MEKKKPVRIEFKDIIIKDIERNTILECDYFLIERDSWYQDHVNLLPPEKTDDLKMAVETARDAKEIIIFQPRRERVKVYTNPHSEKLDGHGPRKFTPESERKTRKIGRAIKRTMRKNINEFLDFLNTEGV